MSLRSALQAPLLADTGAGGLCAATNPLLGAGAQSVFPRAGSAPDPSTPTPWLLVDPDLFVPPVGDPWGTTQVGTVHFRAFDDAAQGGFRLARVLARVQTLFPRGTCHYDDAAGFAYWCSYGGVSPVRWDPAYQRQQQWLDLHLQRNVT